MTKKKLYLFSLAATIASTFIPAVGVEHNEFRHLYGFPAQVFGYYETGHFSFKWLGFIFNFYVFYFVAKIGSKLFLSFMK
ncbi:hypothetical protein ACFVHQ_02780 [Actinomycetes bacterium NPDC127524]